MAEDERHLPRLPEFAGAVVGGHSMLISIVLDDIIIFCIISNLAVAPFFRGLYLCIHGGVFDGSDRIQKWLMNKDQNNEKHKENGGRVGSFYLVWQLWTFDTYCSYGTGSRWGSVHVNFVEWEQGKFFFFKKKNGFLPIIYFNTKYGYITSTLKKSKTIV